MTARQVAGLVAAAARAADTQEAATIAVLRTLKSLDAWVCRMTEDQHGFTLTSPYAPEEETR